MHQNLRKNLNLWLKSLNVAYLDKASKIRIPAERYSLKRLKDKREHPQVRVQGINHRTNRKFDILCDKEIADLIFALNRGGVRTCFSCQGGDILDAKDVPTGRRNGAYISIVSPSPKYLAWAHNLIHNYFRTYYINTNTDTCGRITFHMYNTKQSLYALADLQQENISENLENMKYCAHRAITDFPMDSDKDKHDQTTMKGKH